MFNASTGDFRYLFVHSETTAKEVVMVSVGEFGLCNSQSNKSSNEVKSSLNYSLYEVSVVPGAGNTIKQKRLPDQLNNLGDRASHTQPRLVSSSRKRMKII
jgi:Rap guanine nucleotide exchange factor 2